MALNCFRFAIPAEALRFQLIFIFVWGNCMLGHVSAPGVEIRVWGVRISGKALVLYLFDPKKPTFRFCALLNLGCLVALAHTKAGRGH